jgi:hypothetical protein
LGLILWGFFFKLNFILFYVILNQGWDWVSMGMGQGGFFLFPTLLKIH